MPFITQGKTNWKFLLIVVVLAAIVGGGVWWWQKSMPEPEVITILSQNETADWQIYRNEEYGFEIKYPSFLEVGELGCRISEIEDTIFIGPISLKFFDAQGLTLNEWIDRKISESEEDTKEMQERFKQAGYENWQEFGSKLLSREEIFVAGERAAKLSYQFIGAGFDLPVTISVKRGGQIYDFRTNDANLVDEECAARFGKKPSEFMELMLSTFKFIEEPQSGSKALFVYLTDKEYDGNLGGRSGSDAKCAPPAGLNCESGTVHSLISVSEDDSIINMTKNYSFNTDMPIYWYNRDTKGTLILANDWGGMINVDSNGMNSGIINGQVEGTGMGDLPWTGGLGDEDIYSCNQWTSNEGDPEIAMGHYGIMGGRFKETLFSAEGWAGISSAMVCKNQRYLLCICEGSI